MKYLCLCKVQNDKLGIIKDKIYYYRFSMWNISKRGSKSRKMKLFGVWEKNEHDQFLLTWLITEYYVKEGETFDKYFIT